MAEQEEEALPLVKSRQGPVSGPAENDTLTETTERRRALSPDDLAVAVLSGRRVLLFQRDRMGGGGGRHQGCGFAATLADGDDRGRRRLLRLRVLPPRASGGRRSFERAVARGRGIVRRLHADARSAIWRRRRKAAPSSRRRARPGRATRWSACRRHGMARSPIRSRSVSRRPDTASRSSRPCRLICMPWSRTGFRPACGSFRSGRPTASACWPRLSRSLRKTVARALEDAARRGRLVGVPLRSRQRAA